ELNHFYHSAAHQSELGATLETPYGMMIAIVAGLIIGSVSFSGSIIAYLKLNGTMGKPVRPPQYNIINLLVMLGTLAFGGYIVASGGSMPLAYGLFACALLYGVLFTIPIGGADMPVVISLLNSFTG